MAEIVWSPRSLKDIEQIAEYIAHDSIQYAEEQVKQFFNRAALLESYPTMGRIVPEIQLSSIRQLLCGNYRIIYELRSPESVSILTIHHQSRLLKNNPGMKKLVKKKRK